MQDELPAFVPTSLTHREFWAKIAQQIEAGNDRVKGLLRGIDEIAHTYPAPTASDYLAAKRSNDRKRLDDVWRSVRPRFAQLVANRLLRGIEADADDRLLNWLFAMTFEPTWVVSAHLPGMDLPLSGSPQLDLAATEFAMELAEASEVLSPWIDAQSSSLAKSIVNEIDRRVLKPFGDGAQVWWHDLERRPKTNNWSGVCGGSILAACESLAAQGLPRPKARARAIETLNHFLHNGFTESGECDEGIGYWLYGVEFACHGLMRLSGAQLSQEIDVPRLRAVAAYPGNAHLFGDTFFAGNDTGRTASPGVGTAWLARATGDAFLRWWMHGAKLSGSRTVAHVLRTVVEPVSDAERDASPSYPVLRQLVDQQVAIFQSRVADQLITFTITGGNNDENHNHNDLGTFQFFVNERPLIPDLGAPKYTSDFFGKQRYTKYLVAASGGHCCPSFNGVEQREGAVAQANVLEARSDAKAPAFEVDCTAAYPPEAGLERWTRRATFDVDSGSVQLTDRFIARNGPIVHRIWTDDGEPRINADGVVETASLHLSIAPKPVKLEVVPFKAGDERLLLREWKPDHVLYRIDAAFDAGDLTVETTIRAR